MVMYMLQVWNKMLENLAAKYNMKIETHNDSNIIVITQWRV